MMIILSKIIEILFLLLLFIVIGVIVEALIMLNRQRLNSEVFTKYHRNTGIKLKNIPYNDKKPEKNHNFNMYIPKNAGKNGPSDIILFLHGGSWSIGDKRSYEHFAKHFFNKGYITVNMNYSLLNLTNGKVCIEDMLKDMDDAIDKARDILNSKGIVMGNVAMGGMSAGGHLALLYAYSKRNSGKGFKVPFVFVQVAPTDFHEETWRFSNLNESFMTSAISKLIGKLVGQEITKEMIEDGELEEIIQRISPASQVDESSPPTIFAYAGRDALVRKQNRVKLRRALQKNGVRHEDIYYPKSSHMLFSDREQYYKFIETSEKWAEEYLKR